MKKIQVNSILLTILIALSLLVSVININQQIAFNNDSKNKNNLQYLSSAMTYSEEVELNSAPEYSENIEKMKSKYYDIFLYKLNDLLKNKSTDSLEKIIDKIDKAIENIKWNDKVSLEKQEKILAQLLALKELIEKDLNEAYEYSIDIDLDELLKA